MADVLSIADAKSSGGLRLVLTGGVPGPWGEAAKGLFHAKGIPFARVGQEPGATNDELVAWTGHDNAPIAVYEDEPARASWSEIVLLAERLAPEPALLPRDPAERAIMFGLSHDLCGEWGFGWVRRLMLLHNVLSLPEVPPAIRPSVERLAGKYGYSTAAAEAAPIRAAEILRLLSARLEAQRNCGSRYLVGDQLSAVDIHWAAFAAMVEPLPEEYCAMGEGMRQQYRIHDAVLREAVAPILLEHRDAIYREHMEFPLVF